MSDENKKVSLKGWLSLIILIIMFSGALSGVKGPLKALDFNNLTGSFGVIAGKIDFHGSKGTGVKEGFLFALTLIPTVMFAMGLINVAESLGALKAAEKVFTPLLKPLLGIPGSAGLVFVSSFTSTDVAAVLTKELAEENLITDDERTIFVSYQIAASAVIVNTITCGAPLVPISKLSIGVIFAVEIIVKILGANIVRVILKYDSKKNNERRIENVTAS
ncbi:nucleoside recognition domain-containing protein [Clostridium drakei]|uniref:Nucleoside transporter/FeoB GTPase Gate domain-containing protein n=1 Tax=Clostridium drakei TaxID=332101 RepID=A0A2U8DNT3_9CLOT|nr:nucleoside recognition domain-containing protein [Clostridium drakei]AWI04111.1 hypothetical protein B9W14_06245 [Clostridium drakei]